MRMAIKGIGVTGGFGCGINELAEALRSGVSRFGNISFPSADGELELPAFRAGTARLEEFVPKRTLRRVDHYSKLGLLGSYLALQDGGMLGSDLSRVGVVIASGYGATATTFAFLDTIIADGDICASPTHFANSVHNSAAANISIMLGAKGPSLTVSQFEMSVPSALVSARQWLAEGRVDAVLLGAIDELSDLTGYLWYRQHGQQPIRPVAPLYFDEDTAILGEGAAFLLLTRAEDGSGYCAIDTVETGSSNGKGIAIPSDALLVLGADGRQELAERYRAAMQIGSRIACYAPLYGSMPAAAGFDLACSALVLKEAAAARREGKAAAVDVERICALRFAGASEYSVMNLSRL
jgi:3-oxoacyl-[acyl-carrier-protein] synthase II